MKFNNAYQKLFRATLATTVATGAFVAAVPVFTQAEEVVTKQFPDVKESDDFYASVMSLTEREIIRGFTSGEFKPFNNVTRGQAAKIIALTLDLDTENVENPEFTDVDESDEYYGAIAALAKKGIISGHIDKSFKPGDTLKRSQMAKIINIGFELEAEELTDDRFTDVNEDADYAGYVQALLTHNITKGTTETTFSPNSEVKRSQLALFVTRSETAVLKGGLIAEDFGAMGTTGYTAGVSFSDGQKLSDVESLTAEWFDFSGKSLGKGTLNSKLVEEAPEATQISMPFDLEFNYLKDGYWAIDGDFIGEPTKVKFSVTFKNGKQASVEQTRIASGDIVAQDFGLVSEGIYTAGAGLLEGKTISEVKTLTAEWFDSEGTLLGKGTLTDKLATDYPELTQLSMPFNAAFDYEEDGYWDVEGEFTGEPAKVKFTVEYTNGKVASTEKASE